MPYKNMKDQVEANKRYRSRINGLKRNLELFFNPFKKGLKCPNCGYEWIYDGSNPMCANCRRGIYVPPKTFFNNFPIKPINDWIIMPLCEFCGKPSVLYDESIGKFVCGNPEHWKVK